MTRMCADCHERPAVARGLCMRCYQRHRTAGTLADHERATHSAAELAGEYGRLADPTLSVAANVRNLAPRLGVKPDALRKALQRVSTR